MIDYSRTHNYQPPVLNNGGYDMHAAVDLEAAAEVRQPLLHRTGVARVLKRRLRLHMTDMYTPPCST